MATLDAVPSKRLFLSIIADYDLCRSICELIDNALDIWVKGGKNKPITIQIDIDTNQQTIRIKDSAGGVKKEEMRVIVGPGQTSNVGSDEVIGIFGVGTKRAVVALAQDIKITSNATEKTYQVEFDDAWLNTDGWNLPLYEVDAIEESTTIINLQRLRIHIANKDLNRLKEHIQVTYAKFLTNNQLLIKVNNDKILAKTFDNWAFPPQYEPHIYSGTLQTQEGKSVHVEVTAGLTMESSPATGEYGVYFYCNDRLIGRALKSYDVGYTSGLAGLPHPSISLTRVIVSLKGETQLMPWNSSKSAINPNHPVFRALREWLIQVVKDYSSLSRRLEGTWPESVFNYPTGDYHRINIVNFPLAKKSYLPPLPKSKPRFGDRLEQENRKIAKEKPWTMGIYEGIVVTDLIFSQKLDQKNRISLIVLDSTLEIAFKEFLVNDSGHYYSDADLLDIFSRRNKVENELKRYKPNIDSITWRKIDYYYNIRCKLVHERASVQITDYQINDYREVVEAVLHELFGLTF